MKISILIPVRNEEQFIEKCLRSVLSFKIPKDVKLEIIVIDGQSDDNTVKIIQRFMSYSDIHLVINENKQQAFALNLGLEKATGDWIMRLDAHAVYPTDYALKLWETAQRTKAHNIGGVLITKSGNKTYSANLVQAITTHFFGVGNSGFRIGMKEEPVDTVPFGFVKRRVFRKIGLFDTRLVRAQDYEFNRRMKRAGYKIWMNPKIKVQYFNQPSFSSFLRKNIFLEAPYNAYMWYLAPYTISFRHMATPIFSLTLIGGILLSSTIQLIQWLLIGFICLYGLLALGSGLQQAVRYRQPLHAILLPACFFIFHFSHGLGVLSGLIRLITRTAPVQKIKEPWPDAGFFRVKISPN